MSNTPDHPRGAANGRLVLVADQHSRPAEHSKPAERLYTVVEIAELASVSPDYVLAAIKATSGNTLSAKRLGRGYRVTTSAYNDWVDGMTDA